MYRVKIPVACDVVNTPLASYGNACSNFDHSYYFRIAEGEEHPGNCVADVNNSGTVSVQDIFDFLNAWFTGAACVSPSTEIIGGDIHYVAPCFRGADINNSGAVSVQDIFDFLAAWFSGC